MDDQLDSGRVLLWCVVAAAAMIGVPFVVGVIGAEPYVAVAALVVLAVFGLTATVRGGAGRLGHRSPAVKQGTLRAPGAFE